MVQLFPVHSLPLLSMVALLSNDVRAEHQTTPLIPEALFKPSAIINSHLLIAARTLSFEFVGVNIYIAMILIFHVVASQRLRLSGSGVTWEVGSMRLY